MIFLLRRFLVVGLLLFFLPKMRADVATEAFERLQKRDTNGAAQLLLNFLSSAETTETSRPKVDALVLLGQIQQTRGEQAAAAKTLTEAVQASYALAANDSLRLKSLLAASAFFFSTDPQKVSEYLDTAETFLSTHPEVSPSLRLWHASLYGENLRRRSQTEDAIKALRAGLSFLAEQNRPFVAYAQALSNSLGLAYFDLADFAAAEASFRGAGGLLNNDSGYQRNLGLTLFHKGDTTNAMAYLERSLSLAVSPRERALSLKSLAEIQISQGRLGAADEFLKDAQNLPPSEITSSILELSGDLFIRKGDANSARQSLSRAMEAAPAAGKLLTEFRCYLKLAFLEGESRKNRLSDARLALGRFDEFFQSFNPSGLPLEIGLLQDGTPFLAAANFGLTNDIASAAARYKGLAVDLLLAERKRGAGLSQPWNTKWEDIGAKLEDHQAFVDYLVYPRFAGNNQFQLHYGAVLYQKGLPPVWLPLGSASEIEGNLLLFQKEVLQIIDSREPSEKSNRILRSSLHLLAQQIWTPVLRRLGPAKDIFLSPDGALNFFPFGTLPSADGSFAVEKNSICYFSSARDFLSRGKGLPARRSAAIFANPQFEKPELSGKISKSDLYLRPLPGARREAKALADFFRGENWEVAYDEGPEATEGVVRSRTNRSILHFATHAFFLPAGGPETPGSFFPDQLRPGDPSFQPMRRARLLQAMRRNVLALAGAQTTLNRAANETPSPSDSDGLLSAEEVSQLDLTDTWLATLSACDTGLGRASAGEGIYGLRRGFKLAGAQNVLTTLWSVDDASTPDLMIDFYKGCFLTGDAGRAMAQVQGKWFKKWREAGKDYGYIVTRIAPFVITAHRQNQ